MSDSSQQNPPGPPPRPPILPAAINEQVFGPKRQMQQVRDAAQKRLKKFHRKFEKYVRKFMKKAGFKERYLQFYDIGYRFEAVFTEVTMDGMDFQGEALTVEHGEELLQFVTKNIKLPTGFEAVVLQWELSADGRPAVLQLIAEAEAREMKRLHDLVEKAPRANNPGA